MRSSQTTQAVRVWCGLAFERVALQHLQQIKRKLGISGVAATAFAWSHPGGGGETGAQIDLVLERADRVTNICEIKYTSSPFEITDEYAAALRRKREVFASQTGTADAIHLTMVSAAGVVRNANWNAIQSEVSLDDLFAE